MYVCIIYKYIGSLPHSLDLQKSQLFLGSLPGGVQGGEGEEPLMVLLNLSSMRLEPGGEVQEPEISFQRYLEDHCFRI